MKFKFITIDALPIFDTHMHSVSHGREMANYTVESVKNCIDNCAKIGMEVVCLTDHVPLPSQKIDPTPDKDCGLSMQGFTNVLLINRSKLKDYASQKNIQLYIGGEFDFFAECQKFYDNFDKTFNPEFKVLGQHFIDTIDVYPDINGFDCYREKIMKKQKKFFCFDFSEPAFSFGVEQKGIDLLVKRYFELLEEALTLQQYDSVAHIDLITKFNQGNKYFNEDTTYKQIVKRILRKMKDKNVALEINMNGIEVMKRLVPNEWIIKEAITYGIPITLGSDTHDMKKLLSGWELTIQLLKRIGIQKIALPKF